MMNTIWRVTGVLACMAVLGGCGNQAIATFAAGAIARSASAGTGTEEGQISSSSVETAGDYSVQALRAAVRVTDIDTVQDASRSRGILMRAYYPAAARGALPVVIFSHGFNPSPLLNLQSHQTYSYIGEHLASCGYVVLHLRHYDHTSRPVGYDRPLDVRAVLDAITANRIRLPGFMGRLDANRIGHAGHSGGAYTSFALTGARVSLPPEFGGANATFLDPRIKAIAPLSPPGSGTRGPMTIPPASWNGVRVPVLMIAGERELDGGFFGSGDNWRLEPWQSMPAGNKFLAILPGAVHTDFVSMPDQQRFSAIQTRTMAYASENMATFFDVYLKGQSLKRALIGRLSRPIGTRFETK